MWGFDLTTAFHVFSIIAALVTAFFVDSKFSKAILLMAALLTGVSLYSNTKHQFNSHPAINQSK